MSKTPVSTLQEYAVKRNWGFPEYTLVTQDSGTHVNKFTYKVTCRSLSESACGTAARKQDAKHVAARELLKLLGMADNVILTNGTNGTNVPTQKFDSYYLPGNVAHEDVFINSVGKLNEHCAIQKLKTPEYRLTDQTGPAHAMNFTMVCMIGSLMTKATANTKKQAKQDAAQVMLDKLVRNNNFTKSHATDKSTIDGYEDFICKIEILDLKIEQPSISMIESAARAKKLFPKLQRFSGTSKIMNNISVNDYHRALIDSVDPGIRQSVRTLLSSHSSISKNKILVHITNLLGLSFELKTMATTNNRVVVSCTLDSTPLIVDTGVGATYSEAEKKAINNSLDSIDILLT